MTDNERRFVLCNDRIGANEYMRMKQCKNCKYWHVEKHEFRCYFTHDATLPNNFCDKWKWVNE